MATESAPAATQVSHPPDVRIRVAADRLRAVVSIAPNGSAGPLDVEYLAQRWQDAGLDPTLLERSVANDIVEEWNRKRAPIQDKVVETPHLPMAGRDARIEFLVDPTQSLDHSGEQRVDFKNQNLIKTVKEGQPLARKHELGKGAPGMDLYGQAVPAPDGNDLALPEGVNVKVSPSDPNVLVAATGGFLQLRDGLLHVNECFVVEGHVDYHTGNIEYDRSALIRGDIQDGFTVSVGGDLEVGGSVGESKVMAGGDVHLKNGFLGAGHGLVTAKGSVRLSFISNQTLRAHGEIIVGKEAFNCRISSRRSVNVLGPLVGGTTMAFEEIICKLAGNEMGTKTELEAGQDYVLHENRILLENKIKELTAHLAKIGQRLAKFREGYRVRKRFTSGEAKLILDLRDVQEKIQFRLPELEKRKQSLLEQIRKGYLRDGIRVRVEKKVYPGVVIRMGGECLRIKEEMAGPKLFSYQQGRIKVV